LLLDSTLFLFLLSPRPSSPLFPYTTLFRSILSVLDRAFDDADKRPITLLYGARTEDELYCLERLLSWTKSIHTFSFIPVLSHEPTQSAWAGRRGLVTEALEQELGDVVGLEAYVCGPPAMIDAAVTVLEA